MIKTFKYKLFILCLMLSVFLGAENYSYRLSSSNKKYAFTDEITSTVTIEEISLDFESEINTSEERIIEVEAKNLTTDIEANISGEDKEKFNYNFTENFDFRRGGIISIGYFPGQEEKYHTAYLTLSSEGATSKEIELLGRSITISVVENLEANDRVWTEKNRINFYAAEGDIVELISMMGQKILQTIAVEGLNAIHIQAKGVLIIKIANQSSKILL